MRLYTHVHTNTLLSPPFKHTPARSHAEPTSGLDSTTALHLVNLLRDLASEWLHECRLHLTSSRAVQKCRLLACLLACSPAYLPACLSAPLEVKKL